MSHIVWLWSDKEDYFLEISDMIRIFWRQLDIAAFGVTDPVLPGCYCTDLSLRDDFRPRVRSVCGLSGRRCLPVRQAVPGCRLPERHVWDRNQRLGSNARRHCSLWLGETNTALRIHFNLSQCNEQSDEVMNWFRPQWNQLFDPFTLITFHFLKSH